MLPTRNNRNPNHGSDVGSSNQVLRKNTLEIEEPNTETTLWYKWFCNLIHQHMIPEIFYFISLVLILYRLQTLSNQNGRVLETVNSMQSQLGKMERKIESLVYRKPNQGISPFDNTEPLEQPISDVLKKMKFPIQDSTEKIESINPQVKQSTEESTSEVSVFKEQYRFNAADYLKGASVDNDYSSSSNLNPILGYDQTNLVLLDRLEPPADKAWCTNDENPVLTINLAKYINPTSVSYQHSKWHGAIPNGAPRTYDVVACLDFYCEKFKPLVSNCQYSLFESNEAEQMCNITSHLDVPSIGKVQFRFRENHGDTKMTCVHLVRVYGETKTPVKIEEKLPKSEKIYLDVKWYYHNSYYFKYTFFHIFPMNRFPLFLFFLLGGIWCDHRLSSEETQYWKAHCGTKPYRPRRFESRSIVGGKPIQGNEAPWAVSIQSKAGECSATIISPRHILTASHCLMKDMNEYDYVRHQTNKECFGNDWIFYPNHPWFAIKNSYGKFFSNKLSRVIMMNFCYQANCLYDDMMILELSENMQLDDYAYPACVSSNPNSQAINTEVTITSYGHDNWDVNNTDSSGTDMLRSGVFQVNDFPRQLNFKVFRSLVTTMKVVLFGSTENIGGSMHDREIAEGVSFIMAMVDIL
ncbi:hypothetical protein B9Z55_015106 [Caenorhabditis nigoni]|uniref:SUN domain-containing protein n=1 Tax=Caenorhabditis nigoni TaxID=1611254 RepID=A0A2G5U8M9_9PELO|nr:hypothetical protein B9Z55_015106 [Caenorhabditis nigoni]